MQQTQLADAIGRSNGSTATRVGQARGGKVAAIVATGALMATTGAAQAAITVPQEMLDVFTDLATAFGTLVAAGAILFGVIRGAIALFKLAGRVFSAAGA
ncbi:hypothetical protein I0D00_08170 [Pseudomonas lalucatii]|uniref:Uncharacterized protein n=1 Tax=Pseudomonas lalucatii TaxID=1424203 RepID=A0ABS5PZL2_9PSED|nr:hypothetical protein [Pseudomonas lalucatii]MBS7661922.1 hypothetical protein [Pseudomonas lalucatii]MBS7726212.1 hypothetical protein [Pseudomonas lalucatii]QVM88217.1 hypothetical protein I0D68_05315 [Pseudomonas lalucatii]